MMSFRQRSFEAKFKKGITRVSDGWFKRCRLALSREGSAAVKLSTETRAST